MNAHRYLLAATFALTLGWTANTVDASDWEFDQSLYTNNPKTGKRVEQFAKPDKAYRAPASTYFSIDGPKPFGMGMFDDFNDPYWGWGGYGGYGYGMGMWEINGGQPIDGGAYSFGNADIPGYESWAD